MSAHYDTYDYPSYWVGREYEHESEIIAIKAFLAKIPKIKSILEIGAGYGRLTPTYLHRAGKVILSDPSGKLLKIAKSKLKSKKIEFIQSSVENLSNKLRRGFDLVILVRVLHHIDDMEEAFGILRKFTNPNSYLILEFANKRHFKALCSEFFHGNLTFLLDIFPKEVRGKIYRKKCIPFKNYHPDTIRDFLKKYGFTIIEERSVSNVRSPFLKKHIPKETLLVIEEKLQKILSRLSFGPSVFILAKRNN